MQKIYDHFDKLFIDYIKNDSKHDMNVLQYHDGYEVYIQIDGERYLFADNLSYTLKKGDVVILKPFSLHYMESRNSVGYERYVMNFCMSDLDFMLTGEEKSMLFDGLENTVMHLDEIDFARVKAYFDNLYMMYNDRSKSGAAQSLWEKLMCCEAIKAMMLIKDISGAADSVRSDIVQKEIISAIRYINSRYNEPIDLDETARMVHMSKYYFCRLFHKTTGVTFLTYLRNVRLSKVHHMLTKTDMPLAEIAERTGFTSVARMTDSFGKMYGMSPRDFRKMYNNEANS